MEKPGIELETFCVSNICSTTDPVALPDSTVEKTKTAEPFWEMFKDFLGIHRLMNTVNKDY